MNETVNVVAIKNTSYKSKRKIVGEQFTIDKKDFPRYERGGLVMESVAPGSTGVTSGEQGVDIDSAQLAELEKLWPVDMGPQEYMEKFPDSEHSILALRILELKAENSETEQS